MIGYRAVARTVAFFDKRSKRTPLEKRAESLRANNVLVGALIVLTFLGFARLYTVQSNLDKAQSLLGTQLLNQKKAAVAACRLRHAGRADQNLHVKTPLRGELQFFSGLAKTGATAQTGRKKAASLAFAAKFARWAKQVHQLPNPKC